jgi:flagellin
MSLVLSTNLNSLVAQNNLTTNGGKLASALQQLSSGMRINTAADDAAGYAISQGMTSQINGINQAARNANDGVSLAQTASGALQEVVNDLQTMRNLAVQSLNATNSTQDRANLDAQFQQLKADINSVASQTQFNGVNLLDGTFQGASFQVGANAGQTIQVSSISSASANTLGYTYTAAGTAVTAAAFGTAVKSGDSGKFTVNGVTTAAVTFTGNQATDLKAVASAINQISNGDGGVIATVNANGSINLSSTTSQIVNSSYSPTGGNTGTSTLANFGIAAQNALAAAGKTIASTIYTSAGATPTAALTAGDQGTLTIGTATTASITLTAVAATNQGLIVNAINATTATNGGISAVANANGGVDLHSATSQTATLTFTGAGGNTGTYTAATLGIGSGTITTAATANISSTATAATIDTADVKSVDNSNLVLTQIDAALQQLATSSAQLGAYQNRFQAAITGLTINSTNLSSARSQIQDTDYAAATSALSKAQILQQASTAMVAQANTIPQNILTLLQKLP